MVYTGIAHFRNPDPFVHIVPAWLPVPRVLVSLSGFLEILGGVGLLIKRVQKAAAWGLIALFIAVFPANVNMAVNKIDLGNPWIRDHPWSLWLRLPLQAVLIVWAWWFTRPDSTQSKSL